MEIRKFAEQVLLSTSLPEKLRPPEEPCTDLQPGPPVRIELPGRPDCLRFAPRRTAPGLPSRESLRDPAKRGVAHHILANHELQAAEVMAWTLLAFPDAPSEFRRGMLSIIQDEQRHTRMHVERAALLGVTFGSLPVNGYIWKKAMSFTCLLDYLAGLPLLFEGANLDHSLELEEMFREAGDPRSAALMRVIHRDEIRHVQFGLDWLRRLKPDDASDWDTFLRHLQWPLRPEKARGEVFQTEARRAAGFDEEFIQNLIQAEEEP